MRLIALIIMIFFLHSLSCRSNNRRNANKLEKTSIVDKDVPDWYKERNSYYKTHRKLHELLNLESLESGFDSIEIRITIDCWLNPGSIIVFQAKGNQRNAMFYSFDKVYHDEKWWDFSLKNVMIKNGVPSSNWKYFSDSLIKTGITSLKGQESFSKQFIDATDCNNITVEVATSKEYRLYDYTCFGLNTHIEEGPGKLHKALKLIESEFNYKRPCEDSVDIRLP